MASLDWATPSARAERTASPSSSTQVRSSPEKTAMADALASSPAACPPMPSATTSRSGPANPESSLPRRMSPTCERAAERMTRVMSVSPAQLEDGATDPDGGPHRDDRGRGDAAAVDPGAVGRAHVASRPSGLRAGTAGRGATTRSRRPGPGSSRVRGRCVIGAVPSGIVVPVRGTLGHHDLTGCARAWASTAWGAVGSCAPRLQPRQRWRRRWPRRRGRRAGRAGRGAAPSR